jgi:hypothetical protein
MEKLDPSVAQQIAQAAIAFQQKRTGHTPQSVAVVLSGDTLLITLHGALSPAEKALAQNPEGAAQVQEFHRQLPAGSTHFAFISQFVEIPDDVVFTVEYSVRAAQIAVYELLGIDRKIPPVTPHSESLHVQFEALVKSFE